MSKAPPQKEAPRVFIHCWPNNYVISAPPAVLAAYAEESLEKAVEFYGVKKERVEAVKKARAEAKPGEIIFSLEGLAHDTMMTVNDIKVVFIDDQNKVTPLQDVDFNTQINHNAVVLHDSSSGIGRVQLSKKTEELQVRQAIANLFKFRKRAS